MSKKFYLTTAITYTSRKPHIGNTYEIVLSDAICRFKRMAGYDVYFLTGTDEHGQKIETEAKEQGISPQDYVDKIAGEVKRIWDMMGATYDQFIRTTDPKHKKIVQNIFKRLYDQGDIYKSVYKGLYCVPCESFFTETQLANGKCPDCGRDVIQTEEEAYFFKMSKYQDRLMKHIEENPGFIQPESRKKEMVNNFLKPGLQDLCVSRTSFKWGVPVDFDDGHVVYVWIDALSNYITALGYAVNGEHNELFKRYWPADAHVIGKDILRFHTIYWPILLMALDLPLPKLIFGHPWLLFGQDKMSKSLGNVMYADDLSELFGMEAIRYYLLSQMPFANDGSITYENIITTYNTDLANTLGNLVNRTVTMARKYFDGKITENRIAEKYDSDLKQVTLNSCRLYIENMEAYKIAEAISSIMEIARRSNKYIDETTPWLLAKDETSAPRLQTVLYNLIEAIRHIGIMLLPIMPDTAENILHQINASEKSFDSLERFDGFRLGDSVNESAVLFGRIDAAKKLEEIEKKISSPKPPEKGETEGIARITIDDFSKVELMTARITSCEKVKKSNKLLKLQLDDSHGGRQVVSGIAPWYTPEDLINKTVIVVANLQPAKLRGEISEGMILAADCPNGDVRVIFADDIAPGSKVR